MPFAHYLLRPEFDDPKKHGAPAGFIFHISDAEETPPEGVGQAEIGSGVSYFTHRIDLETGKAIKYTLEEIDLYFPQEKRWAQYRPIGLNGDPDGFMHTLTNRKITRPIDLAGMEHRGICQMEVPEGADHYTHRIDHAKRECKEYTAEEKKRHFPPTRPGMMELMFESHLNEGKVNIDDLHEEDAKRLKDSFEHHFGEERAAKFTTTKKDTDAREVGRGKPAGK